MYHNTAPHGLRQTSGRPSYREASGATASERTLMRRLLLVLTLLVGVFITIGAAPAVSSAANCTFSTSNSVGQAHPPYLDYIFYQANAVSCSGVKAVRWTSGTQGGIFPGWFDNSAGAWAQGYPCGNVGACGPSFGNPNYTVTSSCTSICSAVIWQNMWWAAHATRSVTSRYYVQIQSNVSPFNWGTLHPITGPTNNVTSSV